MIKSVNQSLWLHIRIHSTPLLPPSCDHGFEFALRGLYVTVVVAVDVINGFYEKILERLTHTQTAIKNLKIGPILW